MSSPIDDPKFWSFEAQLYATKRQVELNKVREIRYRPYAYLHNPIVEGIKLAEDKIKILENLINIYGKNPGNTEHFIGIVYGDRDPYYDTDDIMSLPDEYMMPLRPYSSYYIVDRYFTNGYNKFYVADGSGKYKFLKREK